MATKEKIGNGHPLLYIGKNYGRQPVYKTVQELWDKAIEYFTMETTKSGICRATKSGLTFYLGFARWETITCMKKREPHNDIDKNGASWKHAIEELETFLESCFEKQLYSPHSKGAEFWLKNHNPRAWRDEVTQNQVLTNVTANFGNEVKPEGESTTENVG